MHIKSHSLIKANDFKCLHLNDISINFFFSKICPHIAYIGRMSKSYCPFLKLLSCSFEFKKMHRLRIRTIFFFFQSYENRQALFFILQVLFIVYKCCLKNKLQQKIHVGVYFFYSYAHHLKCLKEAHYTHRLISVSL